VLDVQVNNQADARGLFRMPRNGARNSDRERRTWEREPRPMQHLGLALMGGHYREKFGRRGDPKRRSVLRPGE